MSVLQIRLAARSFATSSMRPLWTLKKNELRAERIDVQPRKNGGLHVGNSVCERERELLRGICPRLADVVAAYRDRVPLRDLARAPRERVRDEPQRRTRRIDVRPARDVLFQDVVLDRSAERAPRHASLLRDGHVEAQKGRGRRVDRHRGRYGVEREPVQEDAHVLERIDGDADPSDFTKGSRIVRVPPHLGWQIERDAEAGLSLTQKVAVAGVRLLRRPEAGVLPHRPEAATMHVRLDAAGEGRFAGDAEMARGVEPRRFEVIRAIEILGVLVAGEVRDPLARRVLRHAFRERLLGPCAAEASVVGHALGRETILLAAVAQQAGERFAGASCEFRHVRQRVLAREERRRDDDGDGLSLDTHPFDRDGASGAGKDGCEGRVRRIRGQMQKANALMVDRLVQDGSLRRHSEAAQVRKGLRPLGAGPPGDPVAPDGEDDHVPRDRSDARDEQLEDAVATGRAVHFLDDRRRRLRGWRGNRRCEWPA